MLLIIVFMCGGIIVKLVVKYCFLVFILFVVVLVLIIDSFIWEISEEFFVRYSLVCCGFLLLFVEGFVKVIDLEFIDVIFGVVLDYVLKWKLCIVGDFVVVIYRIGVVFVIKIVEVKEKVVKVVV